MSNILNENKNKDNEDENEDEINISDIVNKINSQYKPIELIELDSESDSESELESEDEEQEISNEICETNPDFCEKIHKLKYKLYTIIVLKPDDEESDEAQNPQLLETYKNALNIIYQSVKDNITNNTNNTVDREELTRNGFKDETVNVINDILQNTNDYVTNNVNINLMVLIDFFKNQFQIYPFFHLPSFHVYE